MKNFLCRSGNCCCLKELVLANLFMKLAVALALLVALAVAL